MWLRDRDGDNVSVPGLIDAAIRRSAPPDWEEGSTVLLAFGPGEFVVLLEDEPSLVSITCRPRRTQVKMAEMVINNPNDFVFVKMLPNDQISEKRFFEFRELDALAEKYRSPGR
jgi:hypothetical protein